MFNALSKGFGLTFKTMFRPAVTTQYPEVKRPTQPRFHGRHVLNRHADGLAHGRVLLDHARGVLEGHRPATELGELRAQRLVPVVQGGPLQRRARTCGSGHLIGAVVGGVVSHGREPTSATPRPRGPSEPLVILPG